MKIKKRIKSGIKYLLQYPLYILSYIIPKCKKIWIFGAWGGVAYADNARFAFEYISDNTDIDAYWVTKDRSVLDKIVASGRKAYLYNSIKGYYIGARASLAIVTQTHEDVNFFSCGRIKVLNLWHGIPMKKILFDTQDMYNSSDFSIRFSYRYLPFGNVIGKRDFVVSTGKLFDEITKSAFGIPENQIIRIGYPRNDVIYNGQIPSVIDKYHKAGKKVLIYLPTHRNFGSQHLYDPMANLEEVNELLEKHNYVMLYKPHFHEWSLFKGEKGISKYSSIITLKDYDFTYNINSFMPFCDLLITDYSGAYFDFLLTNKPVVFFDFDLEWYKKNTGLYFDYDEIAIGPKAKTWKSVFDSCDEIFMNDVWKSKRYEVAKNVFYFLDGENSKRVYDVGNKIITRTKRH